jgi:hypothetical protein
MRRDPRFGSEYDNPDVVDRRGAPPPSQSDDDATDGRSALVRESDARRSIHLTALLFGGLGLILGRSVGRKKKATKIVSRKR